MSRNGSGIYTLPAGNPVVTGTTITSSWANTTLSDIASTLTLSIASDGQTPMSGNLNMASNKIIALATPTATTDAVNKAYADALVGGGGAGSFTSVTDSGLTSGRVTYATTAGLLTDSANLTFDGTYLTANSIKDSALTSGRITYAGASGLLVDSASLTFDGTTVTSTKFAGAFNGSLGATTPSTAVVTSLTNSGLTSGRVTYATTSGLLTDSANLTFNGTTLTTANDASISGLTVGKGGGAVSTNTSFGFQSMFNGSQTGSQNVALGSYTLYSNTSGGNNTVVGYDAMELNTTGGSNTAIGLQALKSNTTASNNTAVGYQAGYSNSTGANQTALGWGAAYSNATQNNMTAIGYAAAYGTTVGYTTAIGTGALQTNSTGAQNLAVGDRAATANTTGGYNSVVGNQVFQQNTTGSNNTAQGYQALFSNTTASNNTAVGYQAGYSNVTGANSTFLGYQAGYTSASSGNLYNVFVGSQTGKTYNGTTGGTTCVGGIAGFGLTTGDVNTFIGYNAGYYVTTGSKNTVLGAYNGNQGGLDIRTASNYIVLSDGDGNPRQIIDGSGNVGIGQTPSTWSLGKAFQIGGYSTILFDGTQSTYVGNNWYYNAGFKYSNTGVNATYYLQGGSGTHTWAVAPSGTAGNPITFTTALTLNTNGALVLQGGNTSASGVGVAFPATQSASTDANTLDDYEEGTWTPTIVGVTGASGQTYGTQAGNYTKVGNLVTVNFFVVLSAAGTLTGTYAGIGSLPFTSKNVSGYLSAGSISYWSALGASWISLNAVEVNVNTTFAYIYGRKAATAATSIDILPTTDVGNTTRIQGTLTYMTA